MGPHAHYVVTPIYEGQGVPSHLPINGGEVQLEALTRPRRQTGWHVLCLRCCPEGWASLPGAETDAGFQAMDSAARWIDEHDARHPVCEVCGVPSDYRPEEGSDG